VLFLRFVEKLCAHPKAALRARGGLVEMTRRLTWLLVKNFHIEVVLFR
jgi:hypothetical protein